MSKDKYPSIFSLQMEATVLIILQIFFATRAVLRFENWEIFSEIFPSFTWRIFAHVTCLHQSCQLRFNCTSHNNLMLLLRNCFWSVQNFRVGIRFVAFDVESHSKCLYDYLQIYDGPDDSSTVMGRYCGKLLPKELKSNSSQMTIQFCSDSTINKPGFYLNFFSGTI